MEQLDREILGKKNLLKIIVIAIVGVAVLGSASFAGASYYQSAKLIEDADRLKSTGSYADAQAKYNQALQKWKWNSTKISPKISETKSLIVEKASFDAGEVAYQNQNWQTCIDSFNKVTTIYNNYQTAQERLQSCQQKFEEAQVVVAAAIPADSIAQPLNTNAATPTSSSNTAKKTTTPGVTTPNTTSAPSANSKSYTSNNLHIKFDYQASWDVQDDGSQVTVSGISKQIFLSKGEGASGAPGTAFKSFAQCMISSSPKSDANTLAITNNTKLYQSALGLSGGVYNGPYYWESNNIKRIMFLYPPAYASYFSSYNAPIINIATNYSTSQIPSELDSDLLKIVDSLQFAN
jgi:hypothetical protein